MANQNLLTYNSSIANILEKYYAPVAVVPPTKTIPLQTTYCFLASVDPWPNDSSPPVPTQDQQSIKNVFKNIFAAKLITSGDICPVAQRIDWEPGQIYNYYQDNIDILAVDPNGFPTYEFYAMNRYDQVFKCLWNNNGAPSTIEPFFQPGTFNTRSEEHTSELQSH